MRFNHELYFTISSMQFHAKLKLNEKPCKTSCETNFDLLRSCVPWDSFINIYICMYIYIYNIYIYIYIERERERERERETKKSKPRFVRVNVK